MQGLSVCFANDRHRAWSLRATGALCLTWRPQQTPCRMMIRVDAWRARWRKTRYPRRRCDWQEPSVSHMGSVNGPNSQKNHPPQLVVQPPRLRQPRPRGWSRIRYSRRCLSSTWIGLGSLSSTLAAPLFDLFGDLFRSFLHFLRTSTLLHGCYNSEH